MNIGIFGGTFNPPHIGHLRAAEAASRSLGLDRLIIVPSGSPPHKRLPSGTPPAAERLHMARLAFGSVPSAEVSDIEIKMRKPSYTIDTVKQISREYSGARLYLLTGSDMFLTLEKWKDGDELLKLITPAVFYRSSADIEPVSEQASRLKALYGADTAFVPCDIVETSSSLLRGVLPCREGAGYIEDTTYAYIIEKRLYNAKPAWDWIRCRARSMLADSRVAHVTGCEQEAVRLARRWDVDEDDAREAAILHDITKKLDFEEHGEILERCGESAGGIEPSGVKLLHSQTGALLAKALFGVSDTVSEAIRWHTTGKAGMSALEKVIYLADYIEPGRNFEGIDELRRMSYNDLNKAMVTGLKMSIEDITERGIVPDTASLEALKDLERTDETNRQ